MNSSYIPIGGALFLAFSREGSRSLPHCSQTKIFVNNDFPVNIVEDDHLYMVSWKQQQEDCKIETDNGLIVVSPNYSIGLQDINRLKTLVNLWNKKIKLSSAVFMITMWADDHLLSNKKQMEIIDQQEKWMRRDKRVDLFLDIEAQQLNNPKPTPDEKYSIKRFLEEISDVDLHLYKVAAQVDSMPKTLNTNKHLVFMPEEISIVERVI